MWTTRHADNAHPTSSAPFCRSPRTIRMSWSPPRRKRPDERRIIMGGRDRTSDLGLVRAPGEAKPLGKSMTCRGVFRSRVGSGGVVLGQSQVVAGMTTGITERLSRYRGVGTVARLASGPAARLLSLFGYSPARLFARSAARYSPFENERGRTSWATA